jgi:hypothetical protein
VKYFIYLAKKDPAAFNNHHEARRICWRLDMPAFFSPWEPMKKSKIIHK